MSSKFVIKNAPVENQRSMKVIIVGAGFSGICTTIRITQRLKNIDLVVYEKNEGIGGVWWLNRYPGISCDIPSYSYQYTFAPNPHWSSLYAPGPEIRAYLGNAAERFGATRFIKTSHQVKKCIWVSEEKIWKIIVHNIKTGETFEDTANVLVSAKGGLNEVSWPDIPGLKSFEGKLIHSGEWDESYDLRNKRVGIIGNGSSAIQIVPCVQRLKGVRLWCFARSPTWISSSFGDIAMAKLGLDPRETKFSREHQEALARDPDWYLKIRKTIEDEASRMYPMALRGTELQLGAANAIENQMRQRLDGRPDLCQAIIPKFAPGCRRLTPGPGYLEALKQENVHFISGPIQEVTSRGIKLVSGDEMDLEVLICATGFLVEAPPNFEVVGRNGKTLAEKWKPYFQTYLSLTVDEFPNLLFIGGPNSGVGSGSLTSIFEAQCDYIVKVIRKLQKEDYASIEVKPERVTDFSRFIDEYFKDTIYTDECSSWYRAGKLGDRIVGLWPGSSQHCLETMRAPRWEDFIFESVDPSGNLLRWMGNGYSQTLSDGDPSWFLNPEVVDVPEEGRPEDTKIYQIRPYSH